MDSSVEPWLARSAVPLIHFGEVHTGADRNNPEQEPIDLRSAMATGGRQRRPAGAALANPVREARSLRSKGRTVSARMPVKRFAEKS
jgi:hypothetical protein